MDNIQFVTNNRTSDAYGGTGGNPISVPFHVGCYVTFFSGASGDRIDSITSHYQCW
jgi:hypothetical protein